MKIVSVIFVCLGNICRSPMAEAIFKKKVSDKGLSSRFLIASAGTAGYHAGQHADRRVIEILESKNLPADHIVQKLAVAHLNEFDHVVVMDEENFEFVHQLYHKEKHNPPTAEKLFLIRDYDPDVTGVQVVPDPYYESKAFFMKVFEILDRSCEVLLNHLIEANNLHPEEDSEHHEHSGKADS